MGNPWPKWRKEPRTLLTALARHRVEAVGFVTGQTVFIPGEIDRRVKLLQAWVDNGHELGNHTFGHLDFCQETIESFRDDVVRGELALQLLQRKTGPSKRYFRFPMNHTGETLEKREAIADCLMQLGYSAVPFTIENEDYLYAKAYSLAVQKKDRALAQKVRRNYLEFTVIKLDYAEKAAARLSNGQSRRFCSSTPTCSTPTCWTSCSRFSPGGATVLFRWPRRSRTRSTPNRPTTPENSAPPGWPAGHGSGR